MRLSDLTGIAPFELVRDSEFESLGLLYHDAPRMLVVLYDAKFLRRELLNNDRIACVIAPRELAPAIPGSLGLAVAEDPRRCFYEIHDHLWRHTDFYWSDFKSEISPEARVHAAACVAPRNDNVRIGKRCRIAAGACLMGSVRIGNDVWIGPNATVSNQIRVGDGAAVSLGAVVVRDVPAGQGVSGNFAIEHPKFLAAFRDLLR